MWDTAAGPFLAAAGLLVVAGVPKVADPLPLVRALRAAGMPVPRLLVRTTGGTPRLVRGAVLARWQAEGGSTGRYGFPVSDTTATGDGQLTCTFEGGTITA